MDAMNEHLEAHMNGKGSEFLLDSVEYVIHMVARFCKETKLPPFDWNTRRYPKQCFKNDLSEHNPGALGHEDHAFTFPNGNPEAEEEEEEMVESMKIVAKLDLELNIEDRNLLSVGYKNVISARRASWRIICISFHF